MSSNALSSLDEQRDCLPRGWPEMPGLVPVSRRDLDLVHAELDELLRVAASINDGYGSATYLLERLGVTERKRRVFYRSRGRDIAISKPYQKR
jgi:hypothetical protein